MTAYSMMYDVFKFRRLREHGGFSKELITQVRPEGQTGIGWVGDDRRSMWDKKQ